MIAVVFRFLLYTIGVGFATATLLAFYENVRNKSGENDKQIVVWSLVTGVLVAFYVGAYKVETWERVELPNGISIEDALGFDLYAPHSREGLLNDPEDYDGLLREGESGSHVAWTEFSGDLGRIRMNHYYPMQSEEDAAYWLEIYPYSLYLNRVGNEYLKSVLLQVEPWTGLRVIVNSCVPGIFRRRSA